MSDIQNSDKNYLDRPAEVCFKMPGLAPDGHGIKTGYAYLIKSKLKLPELYPLLGEILFGAEVKEHSIQENDAHREVSIIYSAIDDFRETLFSSLLNCVENIDITSSYDREFVSKMNGKEGVNIPKYAFWMGTAGIPGNSDKLDGIEGLENHIWMQMQTLGGGNPMLIYRFFSELSEQKISEMKGINKKSVNIYLFNSISALFRNVGGVETLAFLKRVLERIWKTDNGGHESSASNDIAMGQLRSVFFAILQEGVMRDDEVNYVESFFDGVFIVEPKNINGYRVPRLQTESLPGHIILPDPVYFWPKMHRNIVSGKSCTKKAEIREGIFVKTINSSGAR